MRLAVVFPFLRLWETLSRGQPWDELIRRLVRFRDYRPAAANASAPAPGRRVHGNDPGPPPPPASAARAPGSARTPPRSPPPGPPPRPPRRRVRAMADHGSLLPKSPSTGSTRTDARMGLESASAPTAASRS